MLPYLRMAKKWTLSVILAAAIGMGMWYWYHPADYNSYPNRPLPPNVEVIGDTGIKIRHDTDILQRIVYSRCADEESFKTKATENLMGLTYQQVQKVYSGWAIQKFDAAEVEMTLAIDSLCREHANNLFIGIQDGYVAVFYGKPGGKPLLKEVTKVHVSKLMPQDADEIRRGMPVQSREELLRFIEGLDSW